MFMYVTSTQYLNSVRSDLTERKKKKSFSYIAMTSKITVKIDETGMHG